MPRDHTASDAADLDPTWSVMLRRGARRRCPRCGSRGLFRSWWSVKERCPRCGLLFAREPGYFTGVYLVNLGLVLVLLFVMVMGFAVWRGSHPDGPILPILAAGAAVAVGVPVVFYPFARTIWSALDLAMTPLEGEEMAEAAEFAASVDSEEPR